MAVVSSLPVDDEHWLNISRRWPVNTPWGAYETGVGKHPLIARALNETGGFVNTPCEGSKWNWVGIQPCEGSKWDWGG